MCKGCLCLSAFLLPPTLFQLSVFTSPHLLSHHALSIHHLYHHPARNKQLFQQHGLYWEDHKTSIQPSQQERSLSWLFFGEAAGHWGRVQANHAVPALLKSRDWCTISAVRRHPEVLPQLFCIPKLAGRLTPRAQHSPGKPKQHTDLCVLQVCMKQSPQH